MYLERIKSKGISYLYLKEYDGSLEQEIKKKTVYRFGRMELALKDIEKWHNNINKMPNELKEMNLTRRDLASWLKYLESKIETARSTSTRH